MANRNHTDAARLARLEQALGSLATDTTLPPATPMTAQAAQPLTAETADAPAIDTLFADGWLNLAESSSAQTLSGSSGLSGSDQEVTVTLGSSSYQAEVTEEGRWTLEMTRDQLQALAEGKQSVQLSTSNSAGEQHVAQATFSKDTHAPDALRIYEPVAADGVVAAWEANNRIHVRGRAETEPGSTVTLTFGDQSWQSSVNEWGYWNASMPSDAMQGLPDGNYSFTLTITDKAGNSTTTGVDFGWYVDRSVMPTLTLDPIMEDNAVGCQEGMYGMQISGSSTHLPAGSWVTATLNGQSYRGLVDSDGRWWVSLTDTELSTIPDGIWRVEVSATDPNGKLATTYADVTLITHWESLPDIHFDNVTRDNVVNALELQQDLLLTGSLSQVLPGQTLFLNDGGGKDYQASVQADGRWSLLIPADEVADFIHRGELHAWSQDVAGNFVDGQFEFNIITTLPPVYYELNIGGDMVLSREEAQSDLSFYIEGVKSLTLNGKTYQPEQGMVTLSSEDLLALPDGPVTVTVWQQDEYGNSASSTLTNFFTVETHNFSTPAPDAPLTDSTIENGDLDRWLDNLTTETETETETETATSASDSETADVSQLARLQSDEGHWQAPDVQDADSTATAAISVTLADLLQTQHVVPGLV